MNETRRDPASGAWTIIAPARERRPRAGDERAQISRPPPFDPTCPFCAGNERLLPSIIAETPSREAGGWRTRVIPNKFPAVSPDATAAAHGPLYEATAARGRHEVVIESPRHDHDLTTMSREQVRDALEACRGRLAALMEIESIASVFVFRNHGGGAGASLRHPHSQIVALEAAPPDVRAREAAMRDYYREKKSCVLCDMIDCERAQGARRVAENDAFLTVAPFAAAAPFEMWLLPKRHRASFGDICNAELDAFADALQDALLRLAAAAGFPAYNYVVDTATKGDGASPFLHWRLRIVPQIAAPGGFELASGVSINPHAPEEDAAMLRAAFASAPVPQ